MQLQPADTSRVLAQASLNLVRTSRTSMERTEWILARTSAKMESAKHRIAVSDMLLQSLDKVRTEVPAKPAP